MKILHELITLKKFDYVNSDIEKNFTATEVPKDTEYKLFHFDRYISSEDVIKEIESEGYRVANISELLSWGDWNESDWIIALGSVAEVYGYRRVPGLLRDGSRRGLGLPWFDGDWPAYGRFLAVRNSQSLDTQKSDLGHLDSWILQSLSDRIDKLEGKSDEPKCCETLVVNVMQTELISNGERKEYQLLSEENMETKPCCEKCDCPGNTEEHRHIRPHCENPSCDCHKPHWESDYAAIWESWDKGVKDIYQVQLRQDILELIRKIAKV